PPEPPAPAAAPSDQGDDAGAGLISGVPIAGVPGCAGATPAAAHRAASVAEEDDDHDGHTVMSSAIADLKKAAASPSAPRFSAPANPNAPQILAVTCE